MKLLVFASILAFIALAQAYSRYEKCYSYHDCGYDKCCFKYRSYSRYGYCRPKKFYAYRCLKKPYHHEPVPEPEYHRKKSGYCPSRYSQKPIYYHEQRCSYDFDCPGYQKCCYYKCRTPRHHY